MTTKRSPAGSVFTEDSGSIRRNRACTPGPKGRKRSATAWSVIDSYKTVKVPATSRKGLSKPQYKKTMRKSCSGVRTFLARTKALNSRAMGAVSGGRECQRSSKNLSGSVRGNCMGCFSCRGEGQMFPPCSMPLFSMTYSLSWRIWAVTLAQAYPELRATVVDLPAVTPITSKLVAEAGATDHVTVRAADMVRGPVPGTYEVAIVRELLQVLSADEAQRVLQHIGAALAPGGRLFIIGQILDETHTTPLEAVGFNLIFLNTFYAGESYTEGEHRAWLQAAGFVDVVRAPFLLRDGFGSGLMIAHKREEPGGTRT